VAASLCAQKSEECVQALEKMCTAVQEKPDAFEDDVYQETLVLHCLVKPPKVTFDPQVLGTLEKALCAVSDGGHVASTLMKLPQHGKSLVDAALARRQMFAQQTSWQAETAASTQALRDIGSSAIGNTEQLLTIIGRLAGFVQSFKESPEELKSAFIVSTEMAGRAEAELQVGSDVPSDTTSFIGAQSGISFLR